MPNHQPRPAGLSPTIRQLMILILWAAIVSAMVRAAVRWQLLGDTPGVVCLMVPICFGWWPVPLLVGLVWALDRPGPVRDWYRSCLMIAGSFLGGALFLLQDPACYLMTGRPTLSFPVAPLCALGGFWGGWLQWRIARPGRCLGCGRRTVIAVAHPIRPGSKRWSNTGRRGWCAGCGADCERPDLGEWGPAADPGG